MAKTHFTVVRNEAYPSSQVSVREGHNERKHKNPLNADIVPERAGMNIHFHQNFLPDGTPETYQQSIDRLLAERKIVKYNFKPKSAIIDEFVFDINTSYFEENGGYDFAKKFYEEVYRYAVKEVGSEDYILSAILHADERNKELSEQLGRDVFHYHLHVVYVPVVQKDIKWTKRAGAELAGKVKETIPQINHTDKWPRIKVGRGYINEYSKLQDRYHEHMKAAGFDGFERGVRGSTTEHLEVEEYKLQQDKLRRAEVSAQVEQSEIRLGELEKQAEKKEKRIDKLDEQITVKEKAKATIAEVEAMGKPAILGSGFSVTADELKKLKTLAKKSVNADKQISESKQRLETVKTQMAGLQSELTAMTQERNYWKKKFSDLDRMVKPYLTAIINFPQVLRDFISRHWQERRLEQQQNRSQNREAR